MATLEDRLCLIEVDLQPPRAAGSMTFEDRLSACEQAAVGLVRSPEPRDLEARLADLEAYVDAQGD